MLPTNPTARRWALGGWTLAVIAGSVGVWWLSSYLDELTTLAQTDREAALVLFRTKALPALLAVVAVAVISGAVLLRQGLSIARHNPHGRLLGQAMAFAGFVMAAAPLALISVVFWLLART